MIVPAVWQALEHYFLITDSPVAVGSEMLAAGAYGFGFTEAGQFNIFDVGGNKLLPDTAV